MENIQTAKSVYGQPDFVKISLRDKNIARMRKGGWFEPPLSPDSIPKASNVFKLQMKAHLRHKIIYTILISRSYELGGVTKFPNKSIVVALKDQYNMQVSTQQVVNSIDFLKKHRLIAALNAFRSPHLTPKGASPQQISHLRDKGYFKPRSDRMFMVWASFYASSCQSKKIGWSGLKSDPRVNCDEWKEALSKIPLKYKISQPKNVLGKDRVRFTEIPAKVDWDTFLGNGAIDDQMYYDILKFTEAKNSGFKHKVITVMGRTESHLFYAANREKIDAQREKKKKERASQIETAKQNYGIT